jgi:hypothetical protein
MLEFLKGWFSLNVVKRQGFQSFQKCPGWTLAPTTSDRMRCAQTVTLDKQGNWCCATCGCSGIGLQVTKAPRLWD